MDERRADWKSGWRVHLDCDATRRQRDDALLDHYQSAAFRPIIVGLPYSHPGQGTLDEIVGGAPYGATTVAGGQGQRQPTQIELDGARHQGELIAKTAAKLFA